MKTYRRFQHASSLSVVSAFVTLRSNRSHSRTPARTHALSYSLKKAHSSGSFGATNSIPFIRFDRMADAEHSPKYFCTARRTKEYILCKPLLEHVLRASYEKQKGAGAIEGHSFLFLFYTRFLNWINIRHSMKA